MIAGNTIGVRLLGGEVSENVVRGNLIGLAPDGETAIPNSLSGVAIETEAHDNVIGGTGDLGNVISGNGSYGITVIGAGSGNRLEGNYIGTDEEGTDDVPNGFTGVRLVGGEGVTVGGTAAGAGNVISGNATNGVEVEASDENTISGNYLGPDATGTAAPGGQNVGVQIKGGTSNLVGGTSAAARNVISGNESTGVNLSGASVVANAVEGNYIGLEPDGNTPLPNAFSGVTVAFAGEENTIGGSAAGAGNVISGNGNVGLRVESTEFTEILGNLIGTDASGLLDRGNTSAGILDAGTKTKIGSAGAGNVISGNDNAGLQIASTASPTVEGNTIGLGADGDTVIGNTSSGIDAGSSVGARIGDNGVGEGNVISGNGSNGVRSTGSDELRIEGNLIGTDADGEADRGNAFSGVFLLTADEATVGGTATGAGNTISGNGGAGVLIEGAGGSGGVVEGNVIGLSEDSGLPLGNDGAGVELESEAGGKTIGGAAPGAGNTIAENGTDGVLVGGEGTDNRVLGNSIHDNGDDPEDLGIDLAGDGADVNDLDDEDSLHPNRLQNYPVLEFAETKPGETNIAGTLNSEHSHLYRVEIFAGDSCDQSGNGEGETLIHATTVNTDAGGDAEFDFLFAGTSPGRFATATATDLSAVEADGTSEFSACLPIPPDTAIDSGPSGPTADNTPTFAFSSAPGSATFECRVDANPFVSCVAEQTTAPLADGPHTLEVRALAGVGNADPTPASRSFSVDTTPPETTIESGPSGPTADSTPTFAFSSDEVGATFECRIDAAAFAACTSPHTPAALGDGPHTIEVRSLDALENPDASPASRSFSVDTTPPDTAIDSGPAGTTADATPTFGFSSADPEASFECRVDAAAFAACASPHTPATLADGPHTFEARASDPVGNTDPTPASRSFSVDTTAPETAIVSGPSGATTVSTLSFAFVSPDPGATFECRLAGSAFAPCLSPHTLAALAAGSYVFEVRAVDAVGNADASPAGSAFAVEAARGAGIASLAGRKAKVRGRVALLRIRCSGGAGATCAGRAQIRLKLRGKKGGKRLVVVGRRSFSLSAGQTRTLRVRISRGAARLIGRSRGGVRAKVSGGGIRTGTLKLRRAGKRR